MVRACGAGSNSGRAGCAHVQCWQVSRCDGQLVGKIARREGRHDDDESDRRRPGRRFAEQGCECRALGEAEDAVERAFRRNGLPDLSQRLLEPDVAEGRRGTVALEVPPSERRATAIRTVGVLRDERGLRYEGRIHKVVLRLERLPQCARACPEELAILAIAVETENSHDVRG